MDSITYVIFVGAALVLMCWVAVQFLARSALNGPVESARKRHLPDDMQ